jgi:hypothetical protein
VLLVQGSELNVQVQGWDREKEVRKPESEVRRNGGTADSLSAFSVLYKVWKFHLVLLYVLF